MKKENISPVAETSVAEDKANKAAKKSSYARKRTFMHGGYAVAVTAIFVAVVIMLNIGATLLAKNVDMSVDLTANQDFSISKENKDYIKKIERPVNIVVCSDEDTYKELLYQYVYNYSYVDDAYGYSKIQQYYTQNAYLMDQYSKLNKNITVEYIDTQSTEFKEYTNRYPDAPLTSFPGNILVESTFTVDGEEVNHYRVLELDDIFSINTDMQSYYGVNIITGNTIETALTSAIYAVTADRTYNVAVITAGQGSADISTLQEQMSMNNYDFTVIDSLLTKDIPEDSDLVVIAQPTVDYAEEELDKIDEYLKLKSGRKNTLMYIASANQGDLPNLNDFLSEWGYDVVPEHTVVETDSENIVYTSSNILMSVVEDNGYSDGLTRNDYIFLGMNNVPVVAKTPNDRTLTTVLQIADTAIAYPNDAGDDFKTEDAEYEGPFVGIGVTTDSEYDSNNELMTSAVIMVSSSDLISSSFNSYSDVGNIPLLTSVIDSAVGRDTDDIYFETRTFVTDSFTAPTEANSTVMQVIFVYVLPLAVLALGIFVYIRRRRS